MKIAMTGSTGRVGNRLLPRLREQDHDVRTLTHRLADTGAVEELVDGVDAVVHVAAALRTSTDFEGVNVHGTRALAEAAVKVPLFVHISTNLVYPGGLGRPATEDDPTDPSPEFGDYPRTKALGERAVLDTREAAILRLAFVYGEGDPHLEESLNWASKWPGHQRLHMVHHEDVAQAVTKVLDTGANGIFNVADDSPITAVELHLLNDLTPSEAVQQDFDPWHGIVSTNRAQRDLGFRPRYPSAWAAAVSGVL
ncbi:NAD(P)-dependent oxidoreductase [Lentzea sp. PSKA42]|uniref:NAD(P)-dependent oxidoreductase n=1 Tax=Lentzea indica TaxID=2604800 RepID=A0ABX1FFF9_9PSEU|nr:NAD(P)-dependent oxidoreductase [Lentzea indica]NKE57696.1 NAD(P)-dependent oxidoreductase [Lentzea indica]